jgi:hypothetical protein
MEARRDKKREARKKAKAKAMASETATLNEGEAPLKKKRKVDDAPGISASVESPVKPPKKARSPRNDRLERQGKLLAKLAPHEPPGGRKKGNGKKKAIAGGRGKQGEKGGKWQDERGKRQKKDDKSKPLEIFD